MLKSLTKSTATTSNASPLVLKKELRTTSPPTPWLSNIYSLVENAVPPYIVNAIVVLPNIIVITVAPDAAPWPGKKNSHRFRNLIHLAIL